MATTRKRTTTAKKRGKTSAAPKAKPAARRRGRAGAAGDNVLRVRMYRVGFGDFFLLTVPTKTGPAHILIDCGVHAGNIGTMGACVQDLIATTGRQLALVIVTHFHADHLSGFASNFDEFAEFEVGAVWITNRLDPRDAKTSKFLAQLTSVAHQLKLQLGARTDPEARAALDKVDNALGITLGAKGEGSNDKALRLVRSGFKNKPPVFYYQGGDEPELPDVLKGALTAELLAPSPKDSGGEFSASDNRKEQYLAAVGEHGLALPGRVQPFEKAWPATAADYPREAFADYRTATGEPSPPLLEAVLHAAQPDVLAAAADALDGTLNNQSLVVLFTCRGKKLLFVGDAQWGNWSYWLYGKAVKGADPGITAQAKDILGSIDFYKVGHHGSTNASPIPAVGALASTCVAMCSTEMGAYGNPDKGTEVPRTTLLKALEKQTKNQTVRSDWIKAGDHPPADEAHEQLAKLPKNFALGDLYIDYVFP